jgi:hypothetical protein
MILSVPSWRGDDLCKSRKNETFPLETSNERGGSRDFQLGTYKNVPTFFMLILFPMLLFILNDVDCNVWKSAKRGTIKWDERVD